MKTVRLFEGRVVKTASPEMRSGRRTGRIVVVFDGQPPRDRVVVPESRYQAGRSVVPADGGA
jgi:hypothetical protein